MGSSSIELNGNHGNINDGNHVHLVDIFPLSNYYFGSKDPVLPNDETLALRTERMKSNYAAYGIRTRVEAVILVELFKHPHLLLLQIRNSVFSLPGGRLRPGESDVGGLKRKLSSKLTVDGDPLWEVVACLGMWWRPDFESLSYPYLPPNVKWPKECTKLFLVKLPSHRKFVVPKNQKLIAVPLCQLHENSKLFYDNGAISIILEYMDGGFLEDLLSKVRAIPEPYLAPICKQKDPKDRHTVRKLMVHPFITMYDDLEIDLASYFSINGSPLANL